MHCTILYNILYSKIQLLLLLLLLLLPSSPSPPPPPPPPYHILGLGIKSWQLSFFGMKKQGNIQMEVGGVGALGCMNNADLKKLVYDSIVLDVFIIIFIIITYLQCFKVS